MTMKRAIPSILALLAASLALPPTGVCATRREPVRQERPAAQQPDEEPEESPRNNRKKRAQITFEEDFHHFGKEIGKDAGKISHDFRFTNTGDMPLVILDVLISCSCLQSSYDKRPVAPGESGSIRLTLDPRKSAPDFFYKKVQVISNAENRRETLVVEGRVIP